MIKDLAAFNQSIIPDWVKKNDKVWTKESVQEHIMQEVGENIIWPTTFLVLLKMYIRPDEVDIGGTKYKNQSEYAHQDQYFNRIGKVLAWGPDAFVDTRRFPSGAPCNIGDWILFRRYENSLLGVNKVSLCEIQDDKFLGVVADPSRVDTSHQIGR